MQVLCLGRSSVTKQVVQRPLLDSRNNDNQPNEGHIVEFVDQDHVGEYIVE